MSPDASHDMGGEADITSDAANLRTDLDYLLGEHLILAAKATGAALDGRTDQFTAYGGLLNTNGTDLGAAIGSVYGAEAEDEWNRIWSAHNGFFVDYTTGVATDDAALGRRGRGPDQGLRPRIQRVPRRRHRAARGCDRRPGDRPRPADQGRRRCAGIR